MNCGHAIITGGSSGIGLALAKCLIKEGWNISIISRTEQKLADARKQLLGYKCNSSQKIEIYSADVSDRHQVDKVIQSAINSSGIPELLITCAGIVKPGYFLELPVEIFEQMMAVNYFGTLYAVKAVLPFMRQRGKGHIVMISSGAGLIGIFGYTAYSPAKFAIRGFAEALRAELKIDGIYVSIVYPPDTETPQLIEENRSKPLETSRITSHGGILAPEKVAESIIKGIKRGKFIITPGINMTVLALLHSILFPLLRRYFDHLVNKVRDPRN